MGTMIEKSIVIIVLSIATVMLWIGLEVYLGLTGTSVEKEYESYLTPIDSEIDVNVIDEIEILEDDYLLIDRDWLD